MAELILSDFHLRSCVPTRVFVIGTIPNDLSCNGCRSALHSVAT